MVCKKAQLANTNHLLKALQEQHKIFKKKYIDNKIEKTRNRSRNGKVNTCRPTIQGGGG